MVKITLISLLLHIKFAVNILSINYPNDQLMRIVVPSIPEKSVYSKSKTVNFVAVNKNCIINAGDILISEILFNPRTGGADFVEIYNNSNHEIDLKELQLANANVVGAPANIKNVSTARLMIKPGSY
ncbi:lamin tail domain-containing protein [Pedobacter agri]|uniref:lamin tail domain-containing protein n=1 Tax=Pedobacter agri TaxID=454586 RepID=UPI00292F482E|nr:lamin tail domain-containing protein [Pedobacter agri]